MMPKRKIWPSSLPPTEAQTEADEAAPDTTAAADEKHLRRGHRSTAGIERAHQAQRALRAARSEGEAVDEAGQ